MVINIENMKIDAILSEEKYSLPMEISKKIETFWNEAKKENPYIWNGEQMCVSEFEKENSNISIICKKSNYAHYLYDERIGLPKEYACSSLVAGCLLETSDHYYIVGELAEDTSFPHCMQVSGGSVDNNDIANGSINIFNTIYREVGEELNIKQNQIKNFEIKYISLPTERIHTYILFAKGILNMNKNQMEDYYKEYLEYLKQNNLEIEFSRIHFIKKGQTTEELSKFQNPKRNYLEELLKEDSKVHVR